MIKKIILSILILLLMALTACSSAGPSDDTGTPTEEEQAPQVEPTLDENAMAEAVAATVEAELTRIAVENPSPTLAPTNTTVPEPTEVPSETPEPTIEPEEDALENHVLFISDVTIPDGTIIVGGETFTKTWRLQNIGSSTWTTEYTVVFVNGDRMEGTPINIPVDVGPGQSVEVSIAMVAPLEAGTYTGYWMLATDEDVIFGLGDSASQAFTVLIEVIEPTATPTPSPTPTPTEEPTATPTATTAP